MCVCVYVYVYVYVCVSVCMHVCLVFVCVNACAHLCAYVCGVRTCACACMCVRACMCVVLTYTHYITNLIVNNMTSNHHQHSSLSDLPVHNILDHIKNITSRTDLHTDKNTQPILSLTHNSPNSGDQHHVMPHALLYLQATTTGTRQ